jgi:hypothetical protein
MLDLAELSALDLDELSANLVVRRIDRCIAVIPDPAHFRNRSETGEVAVERLTQGITSRDQPRRES